MWETADSQVASQSDPYASQRAMERESTGIVTPSGTFHQHVPAGYMDFPKVGVMVT